MCNARRRVQCRTPGVRAGGRANGWQPLYRGAVRESVTAIARKNLTSYLHWPYLPVIVAATLCLATIHSFRRQTNNLLLYVLSSQISLTIISYVVIKFISDL